MKIPRISFALLILLMGILLSGCSGSSTTASSWTGVAVDENLAYITKGSDLFAVNLSTGELAWRYPESSNARLGIYANPVITSDGQVLVAAYDYKLYSLNSDGVVNWTFESSTNRLVGSPLVTEDTIFQPSTDHHLYCLDMEGNLKWDFKADAAIWATPIIDGDTLYVSSMDHYLYALSAADGSLIWKQDLGGAMTGSPYLSAEGVLYIGTLTNTINALNAQDGSIIWTTETSGSVWSAPVLIGDSIFFGDAASKYYRISITDGSIIWQNDADGIILGTPALITDGLVFGTESGTLFAIDQNGTSLWKQTINGKLYTGLVMAGDQILAGITSGDDLVAVYQQNGVESWSFTTPK